MWWWTVASISKLALRVSGRGGGSCGDMVDTRELVPDVMNGPQEMVLEDFGAAVREVGSLGQTPLADGVRGDVELEPRRRVVSKNVETL